MTATSPGLPSLLASLALFLALGCGRREDGASGAPASGGARTSAATVEPFAYAAPVSGHYAEVNAGDFDLVDGLAYAASSGDGTVVYVTSKAIASPVLAGSACPMSEARALALLRDAAYVEVMLDAAGRSPYFADGAQLGAHGREEDAGGGYWTIETRDAGAGRTAGSVEYRDRGSFVFDLPVAEPAQTEVSEGDRVQGRRAAADAPVPAGSAVVNVYRAVHKAARAQDLAAFLAAQGFSAEQVAAVRGLPGIEADFAVFAERFLDPGEPEEPTVYEGYGGISASGVNSQGESFANYYEFAPCGGRLLLIGLFENKR